MLRHWNSQPLFVFLAAVFLIVLPAQAAQPSGQQTVERFEVYGDGDALLVPVEVSGKTYSFFIDTGATVTCFDRSLLSGKPKFEVKGKTGSGIATMAAFATPPATLGKSNLQTELPYVVALDLSTVRAVSGHNIYGVVGMDFLRNRVVEINFDQGELLLRSGVSQVETSSKPLKLAFKKGIPYVYCQLPRWGKIQLAIDTGSIGHISGMLESKVCEYLVRKGNARVVAASRFVSASDTQDCQELQCDSLTLGDYPMSNPIFNEGIEGNNHLSLHYLSRFHVTLDFPNKRLYLRPNKNFNRPDRKALTGLHLLKQESGFVVHSVDPQSAADKAGILAGDVIQQIDSQEINHLRPFELANNFSRPGTTLRVTIARRRSVFDVMMELDAETKTQEGMAERRQDGTRR